MDALNWIVASGERITVTILLMIAIWAITWGLHKRWWVPGWMLADCNSEVQKLEKIIEADNLRKQSRLDELEELQRQPIPPPPRRQPRKAT